MGTSQKIITFFFLLSFTAVASETFEVTSYNAGLAHTFVPLAKERTPHLAAALKKTDSDVLCLQEVWTEADQASMVAALKEKYPYVLTAPFAQKMTKNAPACGPWQLFGPGGFGACLVWNCASKSGDELTQCVIQTCREPLNKLKAEDIECAGALMAQVGKSAPQAFATVLNPRHQVGLFSFEGSAGLMLFSKRPLVDAQVLDLQDDSTLIRRAALYAQVSEQSGQKHVLCTHLTANLDNTAPYTGHFASWSEEALFQTSKIIDFMEKKSSQEEEYLMGDFNCSLARAQTGVSGDFEKSCESFAAADYQDFYFTEEGQCTFCADNSLNLPSGGGGGQGSYVLDHVFTKNVERERVSSRRVFEEKVEVINDEGQKIVGHLSDHFGVQMKVK